MELGKLVGEFAAAAGIREVNELDGVWKFSADGHIFGVTSDEAGEKVFLYGEVPAPSPDREEAFRKVVLEANFFMRGTGGAVFSLNPDTGAYTLVESEWLDRLTPEGFFMIVERFINTIVMWKSIAEAEPAASIETGCMQV